MSGRNPPRPEDHNPNPVARARWLRGVSQDELAAATDISARTIQRIEAFGAPPRPTKQKRKAERETVQPTVEQLARIAGALDVPLQALVTAWPNLPKVEPVDPPRDAPIRALEWTVAHRGDHPPPKAARGLREHIIWRYVVRGEPWAHLLGDAATRELPDSPETSLADLIAEIVGAESKRGRRKR